MAEESSSSAWNLVPEFFFDLIARVVPGSILYLLLSYSCVVKPFGDLLDSDKDGSLLVVCGVVLGGGYVFGLVINAATTWLFSAIYEFLRWFFSWRYVRWVVQKANLPQLIPARNVEYQLQGFAFENAKASGRLAKILAEKTLYESMIVVLLVAFFTSSCDRKPEFISWFHANRLWLLGFFVVAWVQAGFAMTIRLLDTRDALNAAMRRRDRDRIELKDSSKAE